MSRSKPSLREELGKKSPFDFPEQEAMLNMLRTANLLISEFERLFRSYRLTQAQYNALRILRGEGGQMPCLAIAERMITMVPDITRLIDRLQAAGLATRHRSEEDRRVVLVSITPEGLERLAELDQPVAELHRSQLSHMDAQELESLNRLLEKARHRD